MKFLSLLLSVCVLATTTSLHAATADEVFNQIQKLKSTPLDPEPQSEAEAKTLIKARIAEIDKLSEQFQKEFADDPRRYALEFDAIESAEIRAFVGLPHADEAAQLAIMQKIAAAPDAPADLKASVTETLAAAQLREDLKTKPLELSFKATDGTEVSMADLKGKVVLVDFWATWCPPCVEEIPNVLAVYNEFKDKGFTIIGISLDEDRAKLDAFVKEKGLPWPQYFDGKGWESELASKFNITSIPEMWLVGKDGKIVSFDARNDLRGQVAALLK